ncbi:MAG: Nif11-like leader peptide family natural product precursor [Atopobiaceae bacterium]|nr:Nif11-like leader peptide family natural product precursor [Atopobiaceae bacterium]
MNIDNLDPELRDKAKDCKSREELYELAKNEGYEISAEELESISGGWGSDPNCSDYCFMDSIID